MAFEGFIMSNPLGIWALAAVIPFLIIYLRRPRIVTKTIPSIMFIMRQTGSIKKFALFRKLITSLLFLLQLLIILFLAYSIAAPYLIIPDTTASKTTYIVIDASSSMQTKQGSSTRFDQAIREAKSELKGSITIIKAGNALEIPLKQGSSSKAQNVLSSLQPDDAPTNLEAAMHKADQLLEGKKARIVVVSDFIGSAQSDPFKAMRILTSKGNDVILKDVSSEANNVGIIDMIIDKEITKVFVKNYGPTREITLTQRKNKLAIVEQKRTLEKNSIDNFDFPTQEGIAFIELQPGDDNLVDNVVYTSTPQTKNQKIVMLSNKESSYLSSALTASKYVTLVVKKPPFTIADLRKEQADIIITHNLNANELLPGDFDGISTLVGNGTHLIIMAQDDLGSIDLSDLLPITITGKGESTTVTKNIINQFTKDVDFGVYRSYLTSSLKNGSTMIASAEDVSPLLVFKESNKGKIIYYGFFDDSSDFRTTPGYPIFWNALINFLVETENLADYNKKIDHVPLAKKVGPLELEARTIVVNLLDERESDVSFDNKEFKDDQKKFVIDPSPIERKIDVEYYLIAFAIILLLLELVYIKYRGDL